MPDQLNSIVQRMINANESEENIASVIQEYNKINNKRQEISSTQGIVEPTTFGGGFKKSLTSGEALGTGLRGATGFAQGAIADLPQSIWGSLKTIGNMITSPIETGRELLSGIGELPGQLVETTQMAGSQPEEFGRMMGQITGQPLTTAGIAKGIPKVPKVAGTIAETTGRTMRRYQPLSGMLPRIIEGRTMRNIERGIGRGIERIGQNLRKDSPIESEPNILGLADEQNIRVNPQTGEKFIGDSPTKSEFVTETKGRTKEQARFNKFLTGVVDFPEEVFTELASLAKEYRKYSPNSPEAIKIGNRMIEIRDFMEKSGLFSKSIINPSIVESTQKLTPKNAPIGQNVKLNPKFTTREMVRNLQGLGFEFQGLANDGGIKLKKVR